ncbi:MAG: hypothetical protein HGB06_06080 [Chlorobaculum sp.]|jgi:hypothetical protein|nr:hypothetical protein [Chlorobaculum sp.]
MKKQQRVFLWAGLALAMPFGSANANLLVNGNLEMPALADRSWQVIGAIPGWTTSFGPGIEIQNQVAGTSFDGVQHVELDSNANSGMKQTVATVPGIPYLLSFAYSPRPGRPATDNGIEVYFNGVLVKSVTADGTGLPDTKWTKYSVAVTPATNNSVVEFRAVGTSTSFGGYVDDIILEARR